MDISQVSSANHWMIEQNSWRYYNKLKKKAMEQEFSWSGLVLSLSIAFFVVIVSAMFFSLVYNSVAVGATLPKFMQADSGYMEEVSGVEYLPIELSGEKMERIECLNLA